MRRSFVAAFAMVVCCSPASAGPAAAPGSIDPPQRTFGCSGSIFRALSKSSLAAAYGASNVSVEKVIGAEGEGVTMGLGWDYGGLVKDWRGGALGPVKPTHGGPGNLPPDCRLDVELAPAPSAPEAATAAVSGEQDFKSDDAKAAAAHIIVTKITFYYGN
jgi:hypothetical protein